MKLRRMCIALGMLGILLQPCTALTEEEDGFGEPRWQEDEIQFPPQPLTTDLKSFYVSATTENRYAVDLRSLSVGRDGVVRYVLVVETPGGARNVSFEGMRCETRERRLYATGRRDGNWSESRNASWSKIVDIPPNRHHAALFLEYFCPGGVIVAKADEARNALTQGIHPLNRMR